MDREAILARLRGSERDLRARGVAHAALFGSRARGDYRPGSDIDIMIDIDPSAQLSLCDYAGLEDDIAGLFSEPVDVANREALVPHFRPAATADAVQAF